jgi:limonene-1,2-epoxide hydrolase
MTPEETVNEFIARVCRFDLDSALELVTDDVEYDNVPMGKVFGPEGIRSVLGMMAEGLADADWVVHRQVASGGTVMNERTDRFRAGDTWIELPVAGVFEVNADGRIALWRDYFDNATFTDQLAKLAG